MKGKRTILHSNRIVIHPDYVGFGLGLKMVDVIAQHAHEKGFRIMSKFSSVPMLHSRMKSRNWKFLAKNNNVKTNKPGNMTRAGGFRTKVITYTFEYIGHRYIDKLQ